MPLMICQIQKELCSKGGDVATNITDATNILKSNLIDAVSRYQKSRVIYYGDLPKTTFEIYKRIPVNANSSMDKVALITPGWEYRPDLVSFDVYGAPDFWWKILEVNGMNDVLQFRSGLTIRLPSSIGETFNAR